MTEIHEISDSVGVVGLAANIAGDVLAVKKRLHELGYFFAYNKTTPSPSVDPDFITALRLFQAAISGEKKRDKGSGSFIPGSITHQWLCASNAPEWVSLSVDGGDGWNNYTRKNQKDSNYYCTSWMKEVIINAGIHFKKNYLDKLGKDEAELTLMIQQNDCSKKYGGYLKPHSGHQTGLCLDLRVPRNDGKNQGCSSYDYGHRPYKKVDKKWVKNGTWKKVSEWATLFEPHKSSKYSRKATRAALDAILSQKTYVIAHNLYFNDHVLIGEGKCRQMPAHSDHLHLTIKPPKIQPQKISPKISHWNIGSLTPVSAYSLPAGPSESDMYDYYLTNIDDGNSGAVVGGPPGSTISASSTKLIPLQSGVDATTLFSVGEDIYSGSNKLIGIVESLSALEITLKSNTEIDLGVGEPIHKLNGLFTGTSEVNILGIRGWFLGKKTVQLTPNKFNDVVALIWQDAGGKHVKEYVATTIPGSSKGLFNSKGNATMVPGTYKYKIGKSKINSKSTYPAVLQNGIISIWRDKNKDAIMDPGEQLYNAKPKVGLNFVPLPKGSAVGKLGKGWQGIACTGKDVTECTTSPEWSGVNGFMTIIEAATNQDNLRYNLLNSYDMNPNLSFITTVTQIDGWYHRLIGTQEVTP